MANTAMMTLDDMDYNSVTVKADGSVATTSKYVSLTGTELKRFGDHWHDGMATINHSEPQRPFLRITPTRKATSLRRSMR